MIWRFLFRQNRLRIPKWTLAFLIKLDNVQWTCFDCSSSMALYLQERSDQTGTDPAHLRRLPLR